MCGSRMKTAQEIIEICNEHIEKNGYDTLPPQLNVCEIEGMAKALQAALDDMYKINHVSDKHCYTNYVPR